MKMLKKIMAVVLTGVMAASMLTGCALSDRAAANALERALNGNGVQPDQKVVYNYDSDLNGKADKVWTGLGTDDTARKAALENQTELTYADKASSDTKYYAYIIVKAPKTSEDNKSENWSASALHKAIYDGNLKTVAKTGDTTNTYTVKNAEKSSTATKAKVNFGVKLVNDGKSETKGYYAIVVVELTKTANS